MSINKYDDEDKFIVAPLDVNNFAGAAEGRLGPWLKCLTIGLGPLVFAPYLLQFTPFLLILIVEIIWFTIVLAYTVGDHKNRVKRFRKQLKNAYSTAYELLNVKKIWDSGCIEYLNGQVAYMLVCKTKSKGSDEEVSLQLERFYSQLHDDRFRTDIYFQNIEMSSELNRRYKLAKAMQEEEARAEYIAILDHNIKIALTKSKLMRPVILVRGRRADFKEIRKLVGAAQYSSASRCFKEVKLHEDAESIEKIFSRDLDTYVSYQDLIRRKYHTNKKYGNKIIGYDLEDIKVEDKPKVSDYEYRRFMVR